MTAAPEALVKIQHRSDYPLGVNQMEKITTDVLIIGGGLAAMTAALEASESPCSILAVSKSKVGNSGATLMAGSNFAAVLPEAKKGSSLRLTFMKRGTLNN